MHKDIKFKVTCRDGLHMRPTEELHYAMSTSECTAASLEGKELPLDKCNKFNFSSAIYALRVMQDSLITLSLEGSPEAIESLNSSLSDLFFLEPVDATSLAKS